MLRLAMKRVSAFMYKGRKEGKARALCNCAYWSSHGLVKIFFMKWNRESGCFVLFGSVWFGISLPLFELHMCL